MTEIPEDVMKPVAWVSDYALSVIATGHVSMQTMATEPNRIHCNALYSSEAYEAVKRERNVFAGKYRSIVALMNKTRQQIQEIFDHIEDEGDRTYFGSTNHPDWLSDLLRSMNGWSFDAMLPKGDINKMETDPYATIREQRARAEAAERERDEARALLDEAVKALEPFTNVAESDIGEDEFDDDVFRPITASNARAELINVGHLRVAAATLTKIKTAKEKTDAGE